MLVQAVKRNNEWIIPDIPEFHAQNEDRIFLDIHLAHKVDKESNADDGQLWNDEYLEENWKRIASKSLADLPEDYEKSDDYHEDGAINAIQNNWKSTRDVQLTSGNETQNTKEQLANALLQRYYEKKKREIVIEIPIELKRKFREDNNLTFLNINEALGGI